MKRFPRASTRQKLLALDRLPHHVMIADNDLSIVYLNQSATDELKAMEPEIRKKIPDFRAEGLVGGKMVDFEENKAEATKTLSRLTATYRYTLMVGNDLKDVTVTPLMKNGKRIGLVGEWSSAAPRLRNEDYAAQITAFNRLQAMISFTPDGKILRANANFLQVMEYTEAELIGRHHSIFVDPAYARTEAYREFWQVLGRGEPNAGEYKRFTKSGKALFLMGSYNPVFDNAGQVIRVEKFVTDVTARVSSVETLGSALAALSQGDLTIRITQTLAPELDSIRDDFNKALDRLHSSIKAVSQAALAIGQGAGEIHAASDDLSGRSERQAASLEETAAALDEITVAVRATAENATRARAFVESAKGDAESSAEVVRRAVAAMTAIEESSQKIGQIIGVIDEIAFQTNLLALNAGVEAARAGDAGRGFAVVASEVRALAQRSAEAAKEIKTLISTSAGQVKDGVELVTKTGEALETIITRVAEINDSASAIAASAKEQASGLQDVNAAVNDMDKATQQNAAMVEETTAAASSLAGEAGVLTQQVKMFKLGRDTLARPGTFVPVRQMA
jgi:methyl-accepting chemotaxis protein